MKNAHDGGFTLTEVLVALLVISLSLGGIWQAGHIVSYLNRRVSLQSQNNITLANLQANMTVKLTPLQPIVGDDILGDTKQVSFACTASDKHNNAHHDCKLLAAPWQFTYASSGKVYAAWPPELAETGDLPRLEAILVQDIQGKNLAVIKFPVEQGRDCQFDMISRTCREDSPVP